MDDGLKQHVQDSSAWMRLLFMLLFAAVFSVAEAVLTAAVAAAGLAVARGTGPSPGDGPPGSEHPQPPHLRRPHLAHHRVFRGGPGRDYRLPAAAGLAAAGGGGAPRGRGARVGAPPSTPP